MRCLTDYRFWPLAKVAFLFIFIFCAGCKKSDERLRRELKREARRAINDRKVALRPLMDSLCTLSYESELRRLTDSLYVVRKKEMDKIVDY